MGKKTCTLVWYRLGCLLNKFLVWCWTHTHRHTNTLWSKASYRAFLIFHPKTRAPKILLLWAHNARHPASLAARINRSRRPAERVRDIRALHPEQEKLTSVRWSLESGAHLHDSCSFLHAWVNMAAACVQQLMESFKEYKLGFMWNTHLSNPLLRKRKKGSEAFNDCDLIILHRIFHFSWHRHNVEIGTWGFALIFIQYPFQIQFSPTQRSINWIINIAYLNVCFAGEKSTYVIQRLNSKWRAIFSQVQKMSKLTTTRNPKAILSQTFTHPGLPISIIVVWW